MKKRTIAGLIVKAVESDDIQSCSLDALSSMKKLSLERIIHAKLLENNIDVRTLNIEVPETGSVEIAGAVASKEEKNRAAEIVKNVNGIFYVNNKLSVLPYHL
jgi:osmotically-inducible protein OsmY